MWEGRGRALENQTNDFFINFLRGWGREKRLRGRVFEGTGIDY